MCARIVKGCTGRGVDVRHGGALMRPPLTPHRIGTRMTMLAPLSVPEAVRILSGAGEVAALRLAAAIGVTADDVPSVATFGSGGKRKEVTDATRQPLKNGHNDATAKGDGTRSSAE